MSATAAVPAREKKIYPAPKPDDEVISKLQASNSWGSCEQRIFGHIARLTNNGGVQRLIILFVWVQMHDKVKKRKLPYSYEELAAVAGCSVRDAQIQLQELCVPVVCQDGIKRSVVVKKNSGKTGSKFHLAIPLEEWPFLPDYVKRKSEPATAETSMPETADEDDSELSGQDPGYQKLPRAKLRAGSKSKLYPIQVGVSGVQYELVNPDGEAVEGAFEAVAAAGTLTIRAEVKTAIQKVQTIDSVKPLAKPVSQIDKQDPLAKVLAGFGVLSDLSGRKLIEDCRAMAPEATIEEIAHVAEVIGTDVQRAGSARNVAGVVLKRTPQWFASAAYRSGMKAEAKTKTGEADRRRQMKLDIDAQMERELERERDRAAKMRAARHGRRNPE